VAQYALMPDVDRPAPGEELNPGPATTPRLAATTILLRGGAETLELLLVRRNPGARFMPGVWVFPGGAVDRDDEGEGDAAVRAAALRELDEEAGVRLDDPAGLVPLSRWITPAQVKIRFDTWFYLAPAPEGTETKIDGEEAVDAGWFTPQGALDAFARDEIELVFPTIKHLEQLAPFGSADELLAFAAGRDVQPVEPKVITDGETPRVVLPGEPGYES